MIYQALKRVFGEVKYAGLALVTSVAVLVFAAWLPNLGVVWQIGTSSSVSLADKIKVLAGLAGSITTNFTLFSALSLVTVALLFGVNVALIAYSVVIAANGKTFPINGAQPYQAVKSIIDLALAEK